MSTQLVRVHFHGDTLDCVERDGKVWISLKRVCENLGINSDGQRTKLRSKVWARTEMISVPDTRGVEQETLMIDQRTLLMLLANIEISRVKEEYRERLSLYQLEVADAIEARFTKPGNASVEARLARQDEQISKLAASVENLASAVAGRTLANASPIGGYVTIEQRLYDLRWFDATKKHKARIRKMTNDRLLTRFGQHPSYALERCVYFNHQIHVLDECIEIVRRQAESEANPDADPNLFS